MDIYRLVKASDSDINLRTYAYRCCSRQQKVTICAIGEVYIDKSRGPSTEPCGTPVGQDEIKDRELHIWMN